MELHTTNSTSTAQVRNDEISLRELILKIREWYRYLLTKWKVILLAGVLGATLGFTYAYFKKPVYTASCTFVFDEGKSGGGFSQYAGLAAMAGINIGGGASDGLFQGDNIIELYKSRTMLQKTLLSYGEFDGEKTLLIDRYIKINGLRESWAKDPELMHLSFQIPKERFSRAHDSVITRVVEDINKNLMSVSKPDKKLSIIEVSVKSKDEQFAKIFNDAVVGTVNGFYIETKTKKSNDNLHILKRQADSVRAVLDASISGVASATDANPNANMALQVLRVPSQRKQVDIQSNTTIYAEIVKNLEMAKLSSRQDAPLIQVVDAPVFPLSKYKVGEITLLLVGLFLGVFFMLFVLISMRIYKTVVLQLSNGRGSRT